MRSFDQIELGGLEWCVWGKDDKNVHLCTVKSIYKDKVIMNETGYEARADYEGSSIDKYLNGKFLHKLCNSGIPYESIVGPVTIFDADTVRQITDASFMLPAVIEGRWWLKGKTISDRDKAVSVYMLQADNNLDIHKECGYNEAGIRAVITVNRSILPPKQAEIVESAVCLIDKTTGITGTLYARNDLSKIFRKEKTVGKSRAHDKVYRLRYSFVICPLPNIREDNTLIQQIKDKASKKGALCKIEGVIVESITVTNDFVQVSVSALRTTLIDTIIDDIKNSLIPQTMNEDRNVFEKLFGQKPRVWYDGYLLDTSILPMTTIKEYIDTVIHGGKT